MFKIVQTFLTGLLILLVSCNNPASQKTVFSPEKAIAKASRYEKDGWIFVHLEGSPEEIGFQNGYLLATEITDLKGAISNSDEKTTGKSWNFFRDESFRLFWTKIPEEYRKEIDGIVNGVNSRLGGGKIDRKDILAMNADLEMPGYYVPWLESRKNPTPEGRCSAIAATGSWTTDGKIVLAHSNWSTYTVGERWNIIMDILPEKGNRIVMDVLPGFIHSGDDFFINSAGLVVTETTITQFFGYDTTGVPEFVRARRAIQYASSIDEWVNTMKEKNNGGYANDWLIGDNKTGEIARLELGLKNQFLERTKDGYFVGANFPVHQKLIREETTFDTTLQNSSPNARKKRWEQLMKDSKGKIDIAAAKKFMGDHYDTFHKTDKAGALTLCGHVEADERGAQCWNEGPFYPIGAVQAKVTDGSLAAEMKLWAIMGHPCGEAFVASDFLAKHPEYSYMKDYLHDMPSQVWSLFGKK
jgi:Phospholipase B